MYRVFVTLVRHSSNVPCVCFLPSADTRKEGVVFYLQVYFTICDRDIATSQEKLRLASLLTEHYYCTLLCFVIFSPFFFT